MPIKDVGKILGKPFKSEEGSQIYLNPKNITRYDTGFPVRLKVFTIMKTGFRISMSTGVIFKTCDLIRMLLYF